MDGKIIASRRAFLTCATIAPLAGLSALPGPSHAFPLARNREANVQPSVLGVNFSGTTSTIFDLAPLSDEGNSVQVVRGSFGGPTQIPPDLAAAMLEVAEMAAMESVSYAVGRGAVKARSDAILIAYQILGSTVPGSMWRADQSVHVSIKMDRTQSVMPILTKRVRRVALN